MPGALFLFYVAILLIPTTSLFSSLIPSNDISQVISVLSLLVAAIGVSPVIGFLIYAFYNPYYERRAAEPDRGTFIYLKNLSFVPEKERARYQSLLVCDKQRKEFIDLVEHTNCTNQKFSVDTDVKDLLRGHLSKYAARMVCGFFASIFSIAVSTVVLIGLFLIKNLALTTFSFDLHPEYLILSLPLIVVISLRLLKGSERVIQEAFILEEYLIRAKEDVVIKLLEELSKNQSVGCAKKPHPNRRTLARILLFPWWKQNK